MIVKTALRLSRLAPAAALLFLAACTDDAAPVEDSGSSATGEVLPGSISDDMIASDSLQSQPPLMAEEPAASGGTAGGGAGDEAADESGEEGVAEEAPADEGIAAE